MRLAIWLELGPVVHRPSDKLLLLGGQPRQLLGVVDTCVGKGIAGG